MNPERFDRITSLFSQTRLSRRAAVKAGSLGVAQLATVGALAHSARAQEATPAADDSSPSDDGPLADIEFLFVQTGTSASFVRTPSEPSATPNADGVTPPDYQLTIAGHTGGTIYFSDRPDRIFGDAPTADFIEGLGFTPANPPNAAIVAQAATGEEHVLILELFEPVLDSHAGTLTYGASVLSDYTGAGLDHVQDRQRDAPLDEEFGRVSLFIDDCADRLIDCDVNPILVPDGDPGNLGKRGMCYDWKAVQCRPCAGIAALSAECNATYPDDCQGQCTASPECPTTFC